MILHAKATLDGGRGGGGHRLKRPYSKERMYNAALCIYVYNDGSIEVAKNRYENVVGKVELEQLIPIFTRLMSDLKLKGTKLEMFKEGLSELLQESINKTLKGEYYERAICAESAGNGTDCNRST